jgi:hypothetical protein
VHADWWAARIARQKEIDASIAGKAEFEYFYDKPYADNSRIRVAGPFSVESLSPHRVMAVDEDDSLIDSIDLADPGVGWNDFAQMVLENLNTSGVQQAHKEDRITFTALSPWPGNLVCAEGRYLEGSPLPNPPPLASHVHRRAPIRATYVDVHSAPPPGRPPTSHTPQTTPAGPRLPCSIPAACENSHRRRATRPFPASWRAAHASLSSQSGYSLLSFASTLSSVMRSTVANVLGAEYDYIFET